MSIFERLYGIKIFEFDLMSIISSGETEIIDKIEEEIQNQEYIY